MWRLLWWELLAWHLCLWKKPGGDRAWRRNRNGTAGHGVLGEKQGWRGRAVSHGNDARGVEGVEHLPSYLSTGQEVQGNQKDPDSKTTPAWGVLSMGCGETSPLCRLAFSLKNTPISTKPSHPCFPLNKIMKGRSSQCLLVREQEKPTAPGPAASVLHTG